MTNKGKTLAAFIAETNKAFKAATPEKKRVMIAKDVILRIKQKNLIPTKGYFRKLSDFPLQYDIEIDAYKKKSLKTFLNQKRTSCDVCAKGSLFCSIIGRVNKMTVEEFLDVDIKVHSFYDKAHEKLLEYFSKEQIDLFETAFEGESFLRVADSELSAKAVKFYDLFETSDERLIAICKNIIKHKGTFKP